MDNKDIELAHEMMGVDGIESDNEVISTQDKVVSYTDELEMDFGLPFPTQLWHGDIKKYGDISRRLKNATKEELQWFYENNRRYNLLAELRLRQKYAESVDPIQYGWTLPAWRTAMKYWNMGAKILIFFGGNRASKSNCAAKFVVRVAEKMPEAQIRCFHQNETRSREEQQKMIYEALPLSYCGVPVKASGKTKGKNFSMDFKQKSGFSGMKCILPPFHKYQVMGSSIKFNTYQQFYANPRVFEGTKEHLIWMTEECPKNLFETLLPRLADYHGKMILDFTTIDGYTELVEKILQGAVTLESKYCDWLGTDVPMVQKCTTYPDCYMIYFHSQDNVFVDWNELWKTYKEAPLETKKTRLLGIPTRSFSGKFPKFKNEAHVVAPNTIDHKKLTHYMVTDPAGGKKFAALWYGVNMDGDIYVYREFPDYKTFGEWCLPWKNAVGKPVGKAGPAQRGEGWGYKAYAEYFKRLEKQVLWVDEKTSEEHSDEVFERIIDMRYANREVMSLDDTVTMTREFEKLDLFFRGGYDSDIETGVQKINDYLDYDTSKPIDRDNKPKLYISSDCLNLIACIQEYTGEGGREEASKDFIDCLRMALTTNPIYVKKGMKRLTGGYAY